MSDSDEISAEDAVLAATQSIAERFTAAEAELTADVAATYAGFAVVCREEMGLEPSVVLRAHLDPLPIVEQLDALDAEPHREATDRWSETFRRAWRAYTDVGVGPRPR